MSPSRMALMTIAMLCVLMKSVKTLFFDALGLLRIGDASVLGQNESSGSERLPRTGVSAQGSRCALLCGGRFASMSSGSEGRAKSVGVGLQAKSKQVRRVEVYRYHRHS